jgi:exopolyphosphatase / guanosine-5'-triphosphate,3'-diphosphate pyrophosphatase
MKTLAAIDLGTNSSLFLLGQVDEAGHLQPLRHEVRTNDLGRGLDHQNRLPARTLDLNLEQLREFQRFATAGGAVEVRVAATEALRRAVNGGELIARAHTELGLEIRILSGSEEAYLTYLGVISGLADPDARVLVADVGGGSTEIILGVAGNPQKSVSLKVGAVMLDQATIRQDPASAQEILDARQLIRSVLVDLEVFREASAAPLIICGGTAATLAAADLGLMKYQPEKIGGHRISAGRLKRFIGQFAALDLESRRTLPGVGRRRAEIILPGALIIEELLRKLRREEYLTSERGLRYGLLLSAV